MPYTTYEFYTEDFFGKTIPEESFPNFELRSRIELDCFTFGRLKRNSEISEEVQLCMCEMMEYLYVDTTRQKGNGISSESTDGHSVSYAAEKSKAVISKDLYRIACKHLSGTGLLYRGIP